jgi:tetratricopeptide (TPR) repeat protein
MANSYGAFATETNTAITRTVVDEMLLKMHIKDERLNQKLDRIRQQLVRDIRLHRDESRRRAASHPASSVSGRLHKDCLQDAERFVSNLPRAGTIPSWKSLHSPPSSDHGVPILTPQTRERSTRSAPPSLPTPLRSPSERGVPAPLSPGSIVPSIFDVESTSRSAVSEGDDTEPSRWQEMYNWIQPGLTTVHEDVDTEPQETEETSEVDIEYDMIRQMLKEGLAQFRAGEYVQAEETLSRVLRDSNQSDQPGYQWRTVCMEYLALSYLNQLKWDVAETLLLELLELTLPPEKVFRIKHALAEAYLGKEDFTKAEDFCKQALAGRLSTPGIGRGHTSYHQSLGVLAAIMEAKGDLIAARAVANLMPEYSTNPQRAALERLSGMKAADAALAIEEGCLKEIIPDKCVVRVKKWDEIKGNICAGGGITGCGETYTLLHALAKYGDEAAVRFLLEKGMDANARDGKGNTALHLAARGCRPDRVAIIETLLKYNAEATHKRKDGKTALMIAIIKGDTKSIPILAFHSSKDIDAQDILPYSALHYAATEGLASAIAVLLDSKANVDCIGAGGRTPLHCVVAGRNCTAKVVRMLLDANADAKIKDIQSNNPYDLAKKRIADISDISVLTMLQKSKLTKKGSVFSNFSNLSGKTLVERRNSRPMARG